VGPRAGLDTEATGKILRTYRGSNPDSPVVQPVAIHYTELPGSCLMKLLSIKSKILQRTIVFILLHMGFNM
jgi:hypothetical protein